VFTCPTSKCEQMTQYEDIFNISHWLTISLFRTWRSSSRWRHCVTQHIKHVPVLPKWNTVFAEVPSNGGMAVFEKTSDLWDLRFSQHRTWRVYSLGIWCNVDWYISDILEILSVSTFRISTWYHVPICCKFNF